MELIEILGYGSAVIIGITLGLLGGGGSILALPVLVYLLKLDEKLATAYSLFIVGFSALIGSISFMQKGLVSYRTAVVFAIPAFVAVFLARSLIIPLIPDHIATIAGFELTSKVAIMGLFAVIMLLASISMIRNSRKTSAEEDAAGEAKTGDVDEKKFNYTAIILEGTVVGFLTGIVGAGGGFLIVPALVVFAKIPMKLAVGTSLLIIAAKSLVGFTGDLIAGQPIDWQFLMIFSALTVGGIFLGSYFTQFVSSKRLKGAFGYFVLVMGVFILLREFVLKQDEVADDQKAAAKTEAPAPVALQSAPQGGIFPATDLPHPKLLAKQRSSPFVELNAINPHTLHLQPFPADRFFRSSASNK